MVTRVRRSSPPASRTRTATCTGSRTSELVVLGWRNLRVGGAGLAHPSELVVLVGAEPGRSSP